MTVAKALPVDVIDNLLSGYKKPEDLIGENGLLKQLTKALVERALAAEMESHLGHAKNEAVTNPTGNARNGTSRKTLKGEFGELPIEIPRDRHGSFEPQLITKHQTRWSGFDEKILSLYARGMTVREIQGHLEEMYGTEVSPTLISSVTDAVSAKHHPRPIAIKSHGEFYIVTRDGRKLSGQEAARLTEDDEVRLVTGPSGGALLTLVDGTHIKLGSNTEYLTKVTDSDPDKGKQPVAELVKGSLRWIHEKSSEVTKMLKETESETRSRLKREGKIRMSIVLVATRGTDFEGVVLPDGSGHIKLYSGEISVTSKLTGAEVTLTHGQMISFTKDKVGAVMPIPGGV